jgi:hypothetical protein
VTTVLGIALILLGVILWIAAGLLPVLRLRSRGRGVADATVDLTWMGVLRFRQRPIIGITGARVAPGVADVELATREGWILLGLPKGRPQLTVDQLAVIIDHYAQQGPPPRALALPLKDRMATMVTFALLFPLGTICVFAGVLLAARGIA